jgi:hypothetical protein
LGFQGNSELIALPYYQTTDPVYAAAARRAVEQALMG